jgi:hypothetical protein
MYSLDLKLCMSLITWKLGTLIFGCLPQLEDFIPKKEGENGWLLQQHEDGESQDTFIWTGWMTGQMDGWKKLHNHNVLYI